MSLGKNINSVLKRYPEVFVPGLGVFSKKNTPARFDKERNLFLPSISYIEFHQHLQSGFNFVFYIQQQKKCSLTEAKELLENEVSNVLSDLQSNGVA